MNDASPLLFPPIPYSVEDLGGSARKILWGKQKPELTGQQIADIEACVKRTKSGRHSLSGQVQEARADPGLTHVCRPLSYSGGNSVTGKPSPKTVPRHVIAGYTAENPPSLPLSPLLRIYIKRKERDNRALSGPAEQGFRIRITCSGAVWRDGF